MTTRPVSPPAAPPPPAAGLLPPPGRRAPCAALLVAALAVTVVLARQPFGGLPALVWLAAALMAGLLLTHRLFPRLPPIALLAAAPLVGLVGAAWVTFVLALGLSPWMANSLTPAALATVWIAAAVGWSIRRHLHRPSLRLRWPEWAVLAGATTFSIWLYATSLVYHADGDRFTVSEIPWSDFTLHLALARSFSRGDNLPPRYPLYGGPPIRYHFGYDFVAGVLERLGLRLDLAFNLPAILGMTALLLLVYELGRTLSRRTAGGVFAALLMPLSSSWAFIDYARLWGASPVEIVRRAWAQTERLHFGPYNDAIISSHFTLTPYINQRQLTLGIAVGLLPVLLVVRAIRDDERLTDAQTVALGVLLGLMFPLNGVVYVGIVVVVGALLVLFRRWSDALLMLPAALLVALPWAVMLSSGERPTWHPGYLVEPVTVTGFLDYWWQNFGLLVPLVLVAALVGGWTERRVLLAFFAPFVLGNLVGLGPDISGINHKVFNIWAVLLAAYAGATLARLAYVRLRRVPRWLGPTAVALLLPTLTLSGAIDMLLVKNTRQDQIIDADHRAEAWITHETPANALFLTAPYFYMPPSTAGRPLYLGFPPFPESAGYNVEVRRRALVAVYASPDQTELCRTLAGMDARIDYVQVGPTETFPDTSIVANPSLWDSLPAAFETFTSAGQLRYYAVPQICPAR